MYLAERNARPNRDVRIAVAVAMGMYWGKKLVRFPAPLIQPARARSQMQRADTPERVITRFNMAGWLLILSFRITV